MGWIGVLGSECVDCGWLEEGRKLLGAAVIVGLERVKPAVVVSQRASLLFDVRLPPAVAALHFLTSVVCRRIDVVGEDHEKGTKVCEGGEGTESSSGSIRLPTEWYDTEDSVSKTRDKKSSGQTREAQVHRLALSRSNQLGKGRLGDGALLPAR